MQPVGQGFPSSAPIAHNGLPRPAFAWTNWVFFALAAFASLACHFFIWTRCANLLLAFFALAAFAASWACHFFIWTRCANLHLALAALKATSAWASLGSCAARATSG